MRKTSEETSTPDHNKRRIILIQGDPARPGPDQFQPEKKHQLNIENLK